jgi:hypothetical protein
MSNIYGINRGAFGSFMINDDVVTLDTAQTISGVKTFSSNLYCDGHINAAEVDTPIVVVSNYIEFPDGTTQATAAVTATGYVTLDTNQYIDSEKTFVQKAYFSAQQETNTAIIVRQFAAPDLSLVLVANQNASAYNPTSLLGDNIIYAQGDNISTGVLNLTCHCNIPTGLRIQTNGVTLTGGSSYIQIINGGTPISVGPVPVPGDTTQAISTNAWVQSAIAASATSNYVTLDTTQTITGAKSFQSPFYIKDPAAYYTTTFTQSGTNLTYLNGGNHIFSGGGFQCNTSAPLAANSGLTSTIITLSSSIPANDNSTRCATTAWVLSQIISATAPTYTTAYFGNYPSGIGITVPAGCTKFDVVLFGTGGLSTGYNVGVPDGSHYDYYYSAPATGGGAQVTKSNSSITIPKQGTYKSNVLTMSTKAFPITYAGASSTSLYLNGANVAEAGDGNNVTSFFVAGTSTSAIPYTNPLFTSWTVCQGTGGQINSESYSSPNTGQLGGGNLYGGISGYGVGGSQNQYGQGQLYGALSGPSYGVAVYPASPVNYGGALITWYIS